MSSVLAREFLTPALDRHVCYQQRVNRINIHNLIAGLPGHRAGPYSLDKPKTNANNFVFDNFHFRLESQVVD